MYQIAICDDDQQFIRSLEHEIRAFFSGTSESVSVTSFTSGKQLAECCGRFFDLYFLDIMMPGLGGFDLADMLRQDGRTCPIIFVSSMHDAVFRSFRFSPLRFVRKEMLGEELPEALTAFLKLRKQAEDTSISITVNEGHTTIHIPVCRIYFIELNGHYLDFHCQDQDHHVRGKLSDYEMILSPHGFARIHQGCLVNFSRIRFVSSNMVKMEDQKQLFISRNYTKDFQSSYLAWKRKTSHILSI